MSVEPSPELDLSVYILRVLEEHLEAVHQIRERMRLAKTLPGGRRELAIEGIVLAEQFAARVGRALGRPAPPRIARHPTKLSERRHGDRSIQSAG